MYLVRIGTAQVSDDPEPLSLPSPWQATVRYPAGPRTVNDASCPDGTLGSRRAQDCLPGTDAPRCPQIQNTDSCPIPLGAATSSHQVEGDNRNNDWWDWEQGLDAAERRSEMPATNGTASRTMPRWPRSSGTPPTGSPSNGRASSLSEGVFDEAAVAHYRDVLRVPRPRHAPCSPCTILHLAAMVDGAAAGSMRRRRNGSSVSSPISPPSSPIRGPWCTVNEPGVQAFMGYTAGLWPPHHKSAVETARVTWHLAQGHRRAYRAIKSAVPGALVGIAHNVTRFVAQTGRANEQLAARVLAWTANRLFFPAHRMALPRLDRPQPLFHAAARRFGRFVPSIAGPSCARARGPDSNGNSVPKALRDREGISSACADPSTSHRTWPPRPTTMPGNGNDSSSPSLRRFQALVEMNPGSPSLDPWLLPLEPARQLRMGRRVHPAFRRRRGPCDPSAHATTERPAIPRDHPGERR